MSDYMNVSYLPDPGVEPRGRFDQTNRIPVITLSREPGVPVMQVQFDPKDLGDAVRYLRVLAAVATDLADQVEHHVAEAVLSS